MSRLTLVSTAHPRAASNLASDPTQVATWGLRALTGRLCELSALHSSVAITIAMGLVLDAQLAGETTAWITTTQSCFFPPDAADLGIDLHALVVIRAPHVAALGRTADHLSRSGAFGLLVIDLSSSDERHATLAMPLQSRLLGLAQKHQMALVALTHKPPEEPSLSSLVSLRGQVARHAQGHGRFIYEANIIKDKQRAPGWTHREDVDGPPGLR